MARSFQRLIARVALLFAISSTPCVAAAHSDHAASLSTRFAERFAEAANVKPGDVDPVPTIKDALRVLIDGGPEAVDHVRLVDALTRSPQVEALSRAIEGSINLREPGDASARRAGLGTQRDRDRLVTLLANLAIKLDGSDRASARRYASATLILAAGEGLCVRNGVQVVPLLKDARLMGILGVGQAQADELVAFGATLVDGKTNSVYTINAARILDRLAAAYADEGGNLPEDTIPDFARNLGMAMDGGAAHPFQEIRLSSVLWRFVCLCRVAGSERGLETAKTMVRERRARLSPMGARLFDEALGLPGPVPANSGIIHYDNPDAFKPRR